MSPTTAKRLEIEDAIGRVTDGATFIDLRPIDQYLDVHIPGSLALLYEEGPGMASRARDCVPLEMPLILLGSDPIDVDSAASALRGKGFTVLGIVEDGLKAWGELKGVPASTEIAAGATPPAGALLDVCDPGAAPVSDAVIIPVERLWDGAGDLDLGSALVVVAGYGVRAALAIGILESSGARDLTFWNTRERRATA
jgi:rhodanese-related sulfurtransferase